MQRQEASGKVAIMAKIFIVARLVRSLAEFQEKSIVYNTRD